MKINYIKELNSSKINLSPLNFWQAIGITILFDIITLFLINYNIKCNTN